MADKLVKLLSDLKEQEALELVKKRLDEGSDPLDILNNGRKGMEVVGDRFADGRYFIPELIYSGEILKGIMELVEPYLKKDRESEYLGSIIIGTVEGDIHDIGKDIVSFMLDISGFEVHDLGIDVPAQKFVDAIKETGSGIVGLSGFLTLAFDSMKNTIDAIIEAGLRGSVKIMIGGGMIDEQIRVYAGADAFGTNAMAGVSLAKEWVGDR